MFFIIKDKQAPSSPGDARVGAQGRRWAGSPLCIFPFPLVDLAFSGNAYQDVMRGASRELQREEKLAREELGLGSIRHGQAG